MVTAEFGSLGGFNDGVIPGRSVALTLVKSKSLMAVLLDAEGTFWNQELTKI